MLADVDAEGLAARRTPILPELASIGDLRPGSLFERYRKCGKLGCHCAREGDPGYGPNRVLTARVNGRPVTRAIPDEAVAEARTQIDEYKRPVHLTPWCHVGGRTAKRTVGFLDLPIPASPFRLVQPSPR